MSQKYTSANTSINRNNLPALYKKVNFEQLFLGGTLRVMDFGCGKYDNGKEYIESIGGCWYGYDKYNRTMIENRDTMTVYNCANFECILCANVLNVIDSDEEIQRIANKLSWPMDPFFVSVYEGDKSGKGKQTGPDQYQRNAKIREYLHFFPDNVVIKKGIITNRPDCIK